MRNATELARLDGLDLARFLAFAGMLLVNFRLAMMGPVTEQGWSSWFDLLEGRASATFVTLAGVGLSVAAARGAFDALRLATWRRAAFLLVLGLLNYSVFVADILHYYACYFALGVCCLGWRNRSLHILIGLLVAGFVVLACLLDYGKGWDWASLGYVDFWTLPGFARNLLFNGWHPLLPWLAFFVLGIRLGRLRLDDAATQRRLMTWGALAMVLAHGLSAGLRSLLAAHPGLHGLLGTAPIPPVPLYMLAGGGAACLALGACLWLGQQLARRPGMARNCLALLTCTGRQTLTLYIAHILLGMGILEALGMLGSQSPQSVLLASLLFCTGAVLYANLWSRWFERGPMEMLMRKVAG